VKAPKKINAPKGRARKRTRKLRFICLGVEVKKAAKNEGVNWEVKTENGRGRGGFNKTAIPTLGQSRDFPGVSKKNVP